MIEFMMSLFHALQGGYHMAEAAYYAGPIIRDTAAIGLTVFLAVMFVRGRSR